MVGTSTRLLKGFASGLLRRLAFSIGLARYCHRL